MIEHTFNKPQYGVVIGKKLYKYKRPKPIGNQKYRKPNPVGVQSFKSAAEAEKAKAEYEGLQ